MQKENYTQHVSLLLARYFIENKNRELLFWGIATLAFSLSIQSSSNTGLIYLTGLIFADRMFKFFSNKPAAIHFLLIPATHLEKLISAILLSTFYFFGMILLSFSLGKIINFSILNLIFESDNAIYLFINQGQSLQDQFEMGISNLLTMFPTFASIQAIFILGSLYFKQNTIAKTMMSIVLILIGISTFQVLIFHNLMGDGLFDMNLSVVQYYFSNDEVMQPYKTWSIVFNYLFIAFLWVVSYYRLVEKEV